MPTSPQRGAGQETHTPKLGKALANPHCVFVFSRGGSPFWEVSQLPPHPLGGPTSWLPPSSVAPFQPQ